MDMVERFLNYISIDTTSTAKSSTNPSSNGQLIFAKTLMDELNKYDIETKLKDGCVYAKIKSNIDQRCPAMGLIAHMDTSSDFNGSHIMPRIIKNYDGSTIRLNDKMTLNPEEFTSLKEFTGHEIIVTDGNSLLGADDKSGITIIMEIIDRLMNDDSIEHGDISICFTPDEEIGRGSDYFDVDYFDADFAYTIDGGMINEVSYETFNAYKAKVKITGQTIHPGSAKHKMINAIAVFTEFNSLLPVFDKPEYTEKYEGFNHVYEIKGTNAALEAEYMLRNHSDELICKQISDFKLAQEFINRKYNRDLVHISFELQYKNMAEILKDRMEIVDYACKAIEHNGMKVKFKAVRGGTDGARLTFRGLPCPNLGKGSINPHGPYECLSVDQMKTMVQVVLDIIHNVTEDRQ